MQIALTIWNGRVAPVLDVARHALLLDINNGRVLARRELPLCGHGPDQQANNLIGLNLDALICGAVSQPLFEKLTHAGLRTFPFIAGNVDEVISAYLAGTLQNPALAMPGCCRRRRSCQAAGPQQHRNRGGRPCMTTRKR